MVFAALGVHVIEPFFAKTIDTTSTHSSLKQFYQGFYDGMNTTVDIAFFQLAKFSVVSQRLLDSVKESYGSAATEAIINYSTGSTGRTE